MKVKDKKCRYSQCGKMFRPWLSTQVVCSHACAIGYAKEKSGKMTIDTSKSKQEQREALMTKSDWMKKAEFYFNKFIRLRDQGQLCISCPKPLTGKYDAGHYRSVGSSPHLRFDENNVHGQCVKCNQHLHGNLVEYRKKLIIKIGVDEVERIEHDHDPKHYEIPDLKEMIKEYKIKAKKIRDNLLDL